MPVRLRFILSLFCIFSFFACSTQEKPASLGIPVEVGSVAQENVRHYLEAIGNVFEFSIVEIRPQVQGTLLKVYVAQGSFVKEGDLLYEIDSRTYRSVLAEAEAALKRDLASLEQAKNTYNRYTDVAKKDYIAALTFDQYRTNVATAEANVAADLATIEQAKINVEHCTISAPIDGKVGAFNVYPGNLVVVNDPNALIDIRQISPIDIRFSIPQQDFQLVQKYKAEKDLNFEIYLPYADDRKWEGKLYFIDNHIDTKTGMILLKGMSMNDHQQFWPGQFVRVRLYTHEVKNALVIPSAAVVTGQSGPFVYVVRNDIAVPVPIKPGLKYGSNISVEGDLKPGEQVVKNGQMNVASGAKVHIVKEEKTSL